MVILIVLAGHEGGLGVLDVPLVHAEGAQIRLVAERVGGRDDARVREDARERDADVAVAVAGDLEGTVESEHLRIRVLGEVEDVEDDLALVVGRALDGNAALRAGDQLDVGTGERGFAARVGHVVGHDSDLGARDDHDAGAGGVVVRERGLDADGHERERVCQALHAWKQQRREQSRCSGKEGPSRETLVQHTVPPFERDGDKASKATSAHQHRTTRLGTGYFLQLVGDRFATRVAPLLQDIPPCLRGQLKGSLSLLVICCAPAD